MKISVILCTYNRCSTLPEALESVAVQSVASSVEWEVWIVDNNSNDGTREVAEGFCRRYPSRFHYLFEPRQGKSHALNAGIWKAQGDVLAFTDDDLTWEPTWLRNLTEPLRSREWAGTGGRTVPKWCCPVPEWLALDKRYALAPFAVFDLGLAPGLLAEPPFGANMAFRREMFTRFGGFRTDLAGGGDLFRNEDTEFGRRLLAAGERLYYQPAAIAYHPVSRDRLSKSYLLKWWFDKARADIRERGFEQGRVCYCGVPLVLFRRLAFWSIRWIATMRPCERFECQRNVWTNAGMISECHRRAKREITLPEPDLA